MIVSYLFYSTYFVTGDFIFLKKHEYFLFFEFCYAD